MQYKYFSIANTNRYIDTFFEIDSITGGKGQRDLILPDCTPGLMFIVKGDLCRNGESDKTFLKTEAVYLFGQKTKAVEYQFHPSGVKAFGAKLKPSSIFTLFGIQASEITDTVIELNEIIGPTDKHLDRFFTERENPHKKIQLILSCLRMNHPNTDTQLLEALLTDIHHSKGELSIQTLAKKYQIGYKKMERLFKRHVGLTPKLYSRIVRFYHCVGSGLASKERRLTDMAYQGGFFDQMHFIKESKRLTGKTPSDLFKSPHSLLEKNHISYLIQRGY